MMNQFIGRNHHKFHPIGTTHTHTYSMHQKRKKWIKLVKPLLSNYEVIFAVLVWRYYIIIGKISPS